MDDESQNRNLDLITSIEHAQVSN